MRRFGTSSRILICLACLALISIAGLWCQEETGTEQPDTSLAPVSSKPAGEKISALELRSGGMASFALYPALDANNPLAQAINILMIFYSIRVGPVIEADVPIFDFLRVGPSLGVLYMTAGNGTGGSLHMFEIPIRFRATVSFFDFHVAAFAGYCLSGVLSPPALYTAGLWEIGAQAGIGALFFEYDMLFALKQDPAYRQFNSYTRIGAGLTFRFL